MSKEVNFQKITREFEKCSLDEQLIARNKLDQWLTAKLIEKANSLQEEAEKHRSLANHINKNKA